MPRPFASPRPRRTSLRALIALLVALAIAPAASAAPVPIETGAGADWGVKESFRRYIETGAAIGEITLSEGATRNLDGTFHFPLTSGIFDADDNRTDIGFAGRVRMTGHHGALELEISNLRVRLLPQASELLADLTSRPLDGGEPVVYPAVRFATLDLSGVDPVIDGGAGTVAWSAIPARLATPAVPAFGGHYGTGELLDPLSFSYAGPGGKPIVPAEQWTDPGTAAFEIAASTRLLDDQGRTLEVGALVPDDAGGVVHAIGRVNAANQVTQARALDPRTLEERARQTDLGVWWRSQSAAGPGRVAFDAGASTIYGLLGATGVRALSWAEGAYELGAPFGRDLTGTTNLAVDPSGDRLYALGAATWTTLTRQASDWTATDHVPGLPDGSTSSVTVTPEGDVLHLTGWYGPASTLDFSVDPVQSTAIPGTVLDEPFPDIYAYSMVALGAPGVAYLAERWLPGRVQRIVRADDGWAVDGAPVETGGDVKAIAVDPESDTVYVAPEASGDRQPVLVYRDGAQVAQIPVPGRADRLAVGADGTLYVGSGNGQGLAAQRGWVWAIEDLGLSPALAQQPQDATADLLGGATSETVAFEVAADGTAPLAVRWQASAPGEQGFADVAGESGMTLEVDATVADDGTRYRAIVENAAGSLASEPATLTVRAAPSFAVAPEDVSVVEGGSAVLKAMPAGLPYPTIRWQRDGGAGWEDVPGADTGFLTIEEATLAQDGTRYRAVLTNVLDQVGSAPVTLTVEPAARGPVTFGGGHVDWGMANRWRCYVVGTVARGAIEPAGGVERVPGTVASGGLCPGAGAGSEALRFPVRGGSWDAASRRLEVTLGGSVRFWGHTHHSGDGRPQLDTRFSKLRLVVEGSTGTLYADATGATLEHPTPVTRTDVPLVTLDLAGAAGPLPESAGLGWSGIASTLTPSGGEVFGSYPAGEAFDPLTLSLAYGTPQGPDEEPPGEEQRPQPPGDTTPPADTPPPRATPPVSPPAKSRPPGPIAGIAAARGAQPVGRGGVAQVARLTCRASTPCRVQVRRRVRVRIGRRRYAVAVLAPRSIRAGRSVPLRVRLPRAAAARLAGRRTAVRIRVVVVADGVRTTTTVRATIRGARRR